MSYYLEIHCDAVMPDGKLARYKSSRCRSFSNGNPGAMGSDVKRAKVGACGKAKTEGWKRRRNGWLCPRCQQDGRSPTPLARADGDSTT